MPLVGSENFSMDSGLASRITSSGIINDRQNQTLISGKNTSAYRPLLPYLESVASGEFPKRWDHNSEILIDNDDWLLMNEALKK